MTAMISVAYCHPVVPAEWIAAHGLEPRWLRGNRCQGPFPDERLSIAGDLGPEKASDTISGRRGVCPYAAAVVDAAACEAPWAAVILTTTCDQMRFAASVLEHRGDRPVLLMNIPSTWQTAAARSIYGDELRRLGRFLVDLGGKSPSREALAAATVRYDRARARLRQARGRLSARQFAEALLAVREDTRENDCGFQSDLSASWGEHDAGAIPLALIGGPVPESDYCLFDWIEGAGGRIVLDATEWGERTLPRPLDPDRARQDPFEELADAYFGNVADMFRRPNDPCHEYLRREVNARQVRGIVVRRYLWCDLWHAEVSRLKAWSPVPVLDLDVAQGEASAEGRTRGRIEAFLEMLTQRVRSRGSGFRVQDLEVQNMTYVLPFKISIKAIP